MKSYPLWPRARICRAYFSKSLAGLTERSDGFQIIEFAGILTLLSKHGRAPGWDSRQTLPSPILLQHTYAATMVFHFAADIALDLSKSFELVLLHSWK
jgi:hypothetical protein